jgi:transcriptional regulator
MGRMTRREEGRQQNGAGWTIEDAPRDYIDKLVRATVGIEIVIERLEGKWKASQNRSDAERARVQHATGMG